MTRLKVAVKTDCQNRRLDYAIESDRWVIPNPRIDQIVNRFLVLFQSIPLSANRLMHHTSSQSLARLSGQGDTWLSRLRQIVFPSSCVSCHCSLDNFEESRFLTSDRSVSDQSLESVSPIRSSSGLDHPGEHPEANIFSSNLNQLNQAFIDWHNTHWCRPCWEDMRPRVQYQCCRCGARLSKRPPLSDACVNCQSHKLNFARATAVGNYEGRLRELVVRMKNLKDDHLAVHLGILLGFELIGQGWDDFDQLVPVPIHWTRRFIRSFQATEILTEQIGRITSMPINTTLIRSVRRTAKQGTLSSTGRKSNVRNAFAVARNANLKGKRILLVDDVLTTGATTSEIARILNKRGVAEVCVAVVARATAIG